MEDGEVDQLSLRTLFAKTTIKNMPRDIMEV